MEVEVAVQKATAAAKRFAKADLGIRVEGVKNLGGGDWEIMLSWLLVDHEQELRENAKPNIMPSILDRLTAKVPPMERVYRRFRVDGAGEDVEMSPVVDLR